MHVRDYDVQRQFSKLIEIEKVKNQFHTQYFNAVNFVKLRWGALVWARTLQQMIALLQWGMITHAPTTPCALELISKRNTKHDSIVGLC